MIYTIVLFLATMLSTSIDQPVQEVEFTEPTIRIYFSPLTTQAHIEEVQAKIVEIGSHIVIDKITFSNDGYLRSYRTTLDPDCEDTMKPVVSDIDLKEYKMGATVIGDQCQHGSMNMALTSKDDMSNIFFVENPPQYEFVTWDGGMEELMKLKGKKIFIGK